MAFDEITDALYTTSEKTQDYVNSTAEYHKLRLFKASMKFTTTLVNGFLLGAIGLFVLLFLCFGLAVWINQALQNPFAGFLVIAGIFILLFILLFTLGKKQIDKLLITHFSHKIFEDDEDEKPTNQVPLHTEEELL